MELTAKEKGFTIEKQALGEDVVESKQLMKLAEKKLQTLSSAYSNLE